MTNKFDDIDIFDPKYFMHNKNEVLRAPRKTAKEIQAETRKLLSFNSKAELDEYYRKKYREEKEARRQARITKGPSLRKQYQTHVLIKETKESDDKK